MIEPEETRRKYQTRECNLMKGFNQLRNSELKDIINEVAKEYRLGKLALAKKEDSYKTKGAGKYNEWLRRWRTLLHDYECELRDLQLQSFFDTESHVGPPPRLSLEDYARYNTQIKNGYHELVSDDSPMKVVQPAIKGLGEYLEEMEKLNDLRWREPRVFTVHWPFALRDHYRTMEKLKKEAESVTPVPFDSGSYEGRANVVLKRLRAIIKNHSISQKPEIIEAAAWDIHAFRDELQELRDVKQHWGFIRDTKRAWELMWEKRCQYYEEEADSLENGIAFKENKSDTDRATMQFEGDGERRWTE